MPYFKGLFKIMNQISIFINKRKIPKNIFGIFNGKQNKSHVNMERFIIDAVSEKMRSGKKSKNKASSDSILPSDNSFVQKEVLISLHIPYDILNEICKIAEELKCEPERYIIKILRDETKGKHIGFCGGERKQLR